MKNQGMHLGLSIDGKPMSIWLTPEKADKAGKLMMENPEKYKGGKGLLQALLDAKKALKRDERKEAFALHLINN